LFTGHYSFSFAGKSLAGKSGDKDNEKRIPLWLLFIAVQFIDVLWSIFVHAEASASLDAWYRIARKAAWKSLADVRITWSSADIFGECTIFNIKGNKYRLIAWINYRTKKIFIRHVLTHAEYTKGGWKYDCSAR
jgi:mRNA interferase HigB